MPLTVKKYVKKTATYRRTPYQGAFNNRFGVTTKLYPSPRAKQSTIHAFTTMTTPNLITVNSNSGGAGFVFTTNLGAFPDASSWQNTFQRYRFTKLEYIFKCCNSRTVPMFDGTQVTDIPVATIVTAIDDCNGTAPVSMAELCSYGTAKVHRQDEDFVRIVYPRMLQTANADSGAIIQGSVGMWIPFNDNNVNYYGLKAWFEDPLLNASIPRTWKLFIRAHIEVCMST